MKKLVAEYEYERNGAAVRIYAVRSIKGVPPCDTMLLEFTPALKCGEPKRIYMRPDEALLLIRLLADAVNRTTKAYLFGLQRKAGY